MGNEGVRDKKNLRTEGGFRFSGGPDGIRTRDLGLDRAACLAATPRVHVAFGVRAVVYHTPEAASSKRDGRCHTP